VHDKLGKFVRSLALCVMVGWALCGCHRHEPVDKGRTAPPPRAAVVDFSADVVPDDPSVTAFIRQVVDTCVSGDYEAFRLLWNAREDPYPRDAFERGWRAVQRVTFVHIRKFRRRAEGDIAYGVRARVELDDSMPEPRREVVFLIIREVGEWRLARPPAGLSDIRRGCGHHATDVDAGESA